MILLCIVVVRQQHILSFLCVYFRPASLLVSTKVSVFFFVVCILWGYAVA
jgi:ABC-type polysaccharide/polyol phosphate export permease